MAQLKTKRSCKLLCQTNSPSCKLSCSHLFQPLLSIILVSSIASSAVAETETGVLTITDANWTVTMDGEWMIKFVAPWCPACAQLKEQWERFSSLAAAMGVSVGEVDVTEQPGLSGRFLVTTLPTIFHVKEGSVRRYVSVREAEEFHTYVSNRRWEEVEPLPSWKSPTSPLMSCMAGLFRLSLWIRVRPNLSLTHTHTQRKWCKGSTLTQNRVCACVVDSWVSDGGFGHAGVGLLPLLCHGNTCHWAADGTGAGPGCRLPLSFPTEAEGGESRSVCEYGGEEASVGGR
ncbi:thioredoxin-related transmembrane protein 4 isoform X1 [Oncorhynchus kisutch]|uniref:thioredoxin-related transmembrane protein 4 isoform X1 n=1 Tax=Oncorhynchus kisutch TaxID=8019 RepID=UPI0012DF459D|nr:thioredoxin-related transmembrane protein 1 isoform X1 [Oncorhynchus kisutch]